MSGLRVALWLDKWGSNAATSEGWLMAWDGPSSYPAHRWGQRQPQPHPFAYVWARAQAGSEKHREALDIWRESDLENYIRMVGELDTQ